ncbi:hypothetical protein [Mannheimia bovis]|uniref:Transferrin-binding protein B C-lobe/N-lobe beta barrel domain-containing protein n=1 Tax=Mannheimia bovis TaxID=2770636 RepID=A0A7H1C333_9PAST|nr:hypothetical protein [Mannheimia bovis]QNS15388.1 hypothetical protein ICJ55_01115 [Mannheimia bovis]
MKPVFKTTALAILVGLGVTACKSNDEHKPAPTPSSANQQANQSQVNQTQTNNGNVEKEKAESEKKAKEAAELKAKEEAEKARLEAEKKAKEAEKARLDAEQKAKEEAEKARLAKEKEENKWRGEVDTPNNWVENTGVVGLTYKVGDITSPAPKAILDSGKSLWDLQDGREKLHKEISIVTDEVYVDGYSGNKERAPISHNNNGNYKLDYYKLAVEDANNPSLLGLHQGEIKSGGINGSVISSLTEDGKIAERTYLEKVDYIFKNTPYSTYGAVYNPHETKLFVSSEKGVVIGGVPDGKDSHLFGIGEYEVVDGNVTTKIKYTDAVKGSATYKGEIIAQLQEIKEPGELVYRKVNKGTPFVDGTIQFDVNFGERAEQNYASAVLDSKTVGKLEFAQEAFDVKNFNIKRGPVNIYDENNDKVGFYSLNANVVGKEASEVAGSVIYEKSKGAYGYDGTLIYNAVFAAEKQPK